MWVSETAVRPLLSALSWVGTLPNLVEAARFYAARHKRTVAKRVADVVSELIELKQGRGASARYLDDLRCRLGIFAQSFQKATCDVTTAEIRNGSMAGSSPRRVT